MSQDSGGIAILFDFSFREFITIKFIGVLYVLAGLAGGVTALGVAASGFRDSIITGMGTALIALLLFTIYIVLARVILESMIVIHRIAENTGELVKQGKKTP
jgi:hypothetical protein